MNLNKILLIISVILFAFAAFSFSPFASVNLVALGLAFGFGSMLA